MDNYFKYLPGFRSNKLWKKIIASAYYFMGLIMLFADWTMGLFWLSSPFVFFSFIDLIQYEKKGIPLKKVLVPFLLSFTLMITGLAAEGPLTKEALQKQQAELEEQAQIEEQENLAEERKLKDEEERLEKERNLKEEERLEKERKLKEEEKKQKELEEKAKAEEEKKKREAEQPAHTAVEGQIKVHYIDVGQGDCALVHTDNAALLIDAGDRGYGAGVVSYIKEQGISKLDYIIFTHPHADHIGGGIDVINGLDVGKIIMPKVSHTSKTFENLVLAVKDKGMKFTTPNAGDEYPLGNASFKILAPNSSSYNNLNDYSVVNKVEFGNTAFLFTGDAESPSESEMLGGGLGLKADVLKVAHHGSDTSTTESFLKAVAPAHAVISCGKGNKYGHPTQPVLARLGSHSVQVYRTDESGTVVATSDGENITFDKGASPIKQNAPPSQGTQASSTNEPPKQKAQASPTPAKTTEAVSEAKPEPPATDNVEEVYITNTGKKYHRGSCGSLSKSKIPISLQKAKDDGYESCKRCHPPQ